VFDPVRPEAVDDLRTIASYARELTDAYCSIRRDLLDEYLSVLVVEYLSIDEVQCIEWKLLNDKMKKGCMGSRPSCADCSQENAASFTRCSLPLSSLGRSASLNPRKDALCRFLTLVISFLYAPAHQKSTSTP
jgi:hypothetical protein